MKNLVLALSLIAPLGANAATNLTCLSSGTGGDLTIRMIAQHGISNPGSPLTIIADGILHTVIEAQVDEVVPARGRLVANVTTLNAEGFADESSGKATITFDLIPNPNDAGGQLQGTGSIHLSKLPPARPPLRLQSDYSLTQCVGEL